MKFLHDIKEKVGKSRLVAKLKTVKNIEIVIAVVLALVAAVTYFAISAKKSNSATTGSKSVQMTEEEARLAELISEISGVGRSRVLITTGVEEEVIGVVVVAEGASDVNNRVKMIRCVEKATGATVDEIEIFEMANGG